MKRDTRDRQSVSYPVSFPTPRERNGHESRPAIPCRAGREGAIRPRPCWRCSRSVRQFPPLLQEGGASSLPPSVVEVVTVTVVTRPPPLGIIGH